MRRNAACAAAAGSPLRRASLHVCCGTTPAWAGRAARATAAHSAARPPRRRGRCAAACDWPPLPADPRPPTTSGRCHLRSRAHLSTQRNMSKALTILQKRESTIIIGEQEAKARWSEPAASVVASRAGNNTKYREQLAKLCAYCHIRSHLQRRRWRGASRRMQPC